MEINDDKTYVFTDINLLFFRYVVYSSDLYEDEDSFTEKLFIQWPWTNLEKHIGKYEKDIGV